MTDSQRKIVRDAAQLAARLAQLARPIVFTNGCFDILHRGHVAYLEEAAALGKSLVVGVNSDASVRRLEKGQNRPVNPLDDRMAVLAALGCVSLVIPFDDDTPLALIKQVRPEHLVKGGDWPSEKIVGADVV
ncbi:MAG: adenylyltransferase/cytidyltransferase family protein, partial [Gammaproteobacteria bacterium]|nr:adenylyltransferase/cytidyltransferase family protein [Gammaproteobacteria bacterium]